MKRDEIKKQSDNYIPRNGTCKANKQSNFYMPRYGTYIKKINIPTTTENVTASTSP
jgi:hypothetical protein